MRGAGKGLQAGAIFLAARVKEVASVPSVGPATPGAPLRKKSGRFRASVSWLMVSESEALIGAYARSPKNFNYPRYWEIAQAGSQRSGTHQTFTPTIDVHMGNVLQIIGQQVSIEVA